MFSGEYMTSQGDSYYLELLFECFDMYLRDWMIENGVPTEVIGRFESDQFLFKDYGDDGVLSYSEEIMKIICAGGDQPVLLAAYLRDYFFMELKLSDTYVCWDDPPHFTDRDVGFITKIEEGNPTGAEITKKGVKFLKRYFVRDRDAIVPWRPTIDYFMKSICVTNAPESAARHVIRLRALACDTYGTNTRAYEHLRRMDNHIVSALGVALTSEVESRLRKQFDDISSSSTDGGDLDDERILHKIGDPEILLVLKEQFPPLGMIRRRTERDDKKLRARREYADKRIRMSSEWLADTRRPE
jgi:hypothetical protein